MAGVDYMEWGMCIEEWERDDELPPPHLLAVDDIDEEKFMKREFQQSFSCNNNNNQDDDSGKERVTDRELGNLGSLYNSFISNNFIGLMLLHSSFPLKKKILQQLLNFKDPSSPAMFTLYNKPLNIVDGRMQYLFDDKGRRYLDTFGGIATVCYGHCHPDIVEVIVNQTKRLQYSTIPYLNHCFVDFTEALANKLPGNLKVVFFTNSRKKENELAMMIARLYTRFHDIISLRNAYHGNGSGTMRVNTQSNWKFNVIQSVGNGYSSWLVDYTHDIEAINDTIIFCSLMVGLIEVSQNSNDNVFNG
ncbi:acetylornithine aminotransferase-like [Hibiscus syriacus]|uniref:acetylornithine aminotransferase-like n=1 Tax=Hibiscus syriacus TaxID=106335 RepID=UPI001920AEDB|nr:acetylornithine aminotransferase-like [Hibiscus syriacus]